MSEIQRNDATDPDVAPGADRDAKIEQLLLVGLDHYFAARYEHAINVWTRALFLDRNHARARAYIERARSALAERQRQSEELLHDGVAAFNRGESEEARRLLQAAIDGGAPPDEALAVLDRLTRLGPPAPSGETDAPSRAQRSAQRADRTGAARRSHAGAWAVALLLVGAVASGAYLLSTGQIDLPNGVLFGDPGPAVGTAPPVALDLSLPLPRRGEMALARARSLAAGGRLHEAIAVLDAIRATDAQRDDANRLRADLQRQLLALTPMPAPAPTGPAAPADRRLP